MMRAWGMRFGRRRPLTLRSCRSFRVLGFWLIGFRVPFRTYTVPRIGSRCLSFVVQQECVLYDVRIL